MERNGAPPLAAPRFSFSARSAGWTLIELSVVLAIASVLIFFAVRSFQPQDAIVVQQAERLRNDIRNVQMLAITWNQPLRITTAAGNYSITCVTAGAAPCNVSPVLNPVTGQSYQVNLEPGLALAGPGFSLDLDTLGRPKNGATLIGVNALFTISAGGTARTVTVVPLTAFVSTP